MNNSTTLKNHRLCDPTSARVQQKNVGFTALWYWLSVFLCWSAVCFCSRCSCFMLSVETCKSCVWTYFLRLEELGSIWKLTRPPPHFPHPRESRHNNNPTKASTLSTNWYVLGESVHVPANLQAWTKICCRPLSLGLKARVEQPFLLFFWWCCFFTEPADG